MGRLIWLLAQMCFRVLTIFMFSILKQLTLYQLCCDSLFCSLCKNLKRRGHLDYVLNRQRYGLKLINELSAYSLVVLIKMYIANESLTSFSNAIVYCRNDA